MKFLKILFISLCIIFSCIFMCVFLFNKQIYIALVNKSIVGSWIYYVPEDDVDNPEGFMILEFTSKRNYNLIFTPLEVGDITFNEKNYKVPYVEQKSYGTFTVSSIKTIDLIDEFNNVKKYNYDFANDDQYLLLSALNNEGEAERAFCFKKMPTLK